jgi:uncharacterized membrane protein
MASERDLAGAALLGAADGMRTFAGPAALAARGRLLRGSPARFAVLAAAAGELVGDKTPMVPPRTSPPALVGRSASGAFTGHALAGAPGAAVGALAAAGSTFGAYRARKALGELTGLPDPVLGVAEDGLAFAAAALATRPAREPADAPEEGSRPRSLARGIVRGVVAGAVGTAAMTGAQLAVMRLTGGKPSHTPEKVGRKVARSLFGKRVPRGQRDTLNQAMHWAYGTSWGIPLGLVASATGRRPGVLAGGAALGLSVWGAGLAELPAFGVAPLPWEQSPAALATDAAYHVVYGVAASAALRVLP